MIRMKKKGILGSATTIEHQLRHNTNYGVKVAIFAEFKVNINHGCFISPAVLKKYILATWNNERKKSMLGELQYLTDMLHFVDVQLY